jgi:AbrB family looped-hinge helix DNA binding protein
MPEKKNGPPCCGAVKVGERGQIVLPVEIRKKFNIKSGEQLFIVENGNHIKLMKSNVVSKLLDEIGD